jgi:putative membrane protein
MTLLEFGQRAYDHNGSNFNGAVVQLTGFVAARESRGFQLARYQIACCSAHATPVVVRVVGTSGDAPPIDQWAVVTGTFEQSDGELPELAATSAVDIEAPNEPYE